MQRLVFSYFVRVSFTLRFTEEMTHKKVRHFFRKFQKKLGPKGLCPNDAKFFLPVNAAETANGRVPQLFSDPKSFFALMVQICGHDEPPVVHQQRNEIVQTDGEETKFHRAHVAHSNRNAFRQVTF